MVAGDVPWQHYSKKGVYPQHAAPVEQCRIPECVKNTKNLELRVILSCYHGLLISRDHLCQIAPLTTTTRRHVLYVLTVMFGLHLAPALQTIGLPITP